MASAIEQLPIDALAYDGVSLLVLAGSKPLSAAQSLALRDWILRGGHVVVSLPAEPEAAREMLGPLSDWLPVTIANEPIVVHEFSSLEKYSGRNVRVPFKGRRSIPAIRAEQGVVLAGGRDTALVVRAPHGFGSVTVLSLDLTRPPLSEWKGVDSLGRSLFRDVTSPEDFGDAKTVKRTQLSIRG